MNKTLSLIDHSENASLKLETKSDTGVLANNLRGTPPLDPLFSLGRGHCDER